MTAFSHSRGRLLPSQPLSVFRFNAQPDLKSLLRISSVPPESARNTFNTPLPLRLLAKSGDAVGGVHGSAHVRTVNPAGAGKQAGRLTSDCRFRTTPSAQARTCPAPGAGVSSKAR
ncbi:hypothetical protein [Verrucomicrobium sp. 3C]|uniref:hypothetical protein n=1 Tax=Verrucomicrobium sp. 3C TaxID=1134055 RepID=UPI0012DEC378|nr:hypothetical protein [Verrucomicrobium sp. 3C]